MIYINMLRMRKDLSIPKLIFKGEGRTRCCCWVVNCSHVLVGRRRRQMMLVITPSNGLALVSKGMGGEKENETGSGSIWWFTKRGVNSCIVQ